MVDADRAARDTTVRGVANATIATGLGSGRVEGATVALALPAY